MCYWLMVPSTYTGNGVLQPQSMLGQVQVAIAEREQRNCSQSTLDDKEHQERRSRIQFDPVMAFAVRLNLAMQSLSASNIFHVPISHVPELAQDLLWYLSNLPSSIDRTIADSNGSFLHMATLVLLALAWLRRRPDIEARRITWFRFLNTVESVAGNTSLTSIADQKRS
jgi:hypothetical protein